MDTKLSVYNGYRLLSIDHVLPLEKAVTWLNSRRQLRITRAVRLGDTAVLTSHVIRCPHCGGERGAYDRPVRKDGTRPVRVSREVVTGWAASQTTLFEDDKVLHLNEVRRPGGEYVCPNCGLDCLPAGEPLEVTVTAQEDRLTLSCQVQDARDLIRMADGGVMLDLFCPTEQKMVFDLAAGSARFFITNEKRTVLAERDLFGERVDWEECILPQLLTDNRVVRRTALRHLTALYGGTAPCTLAELTLRRLADMTRFVGYPKGFYDAIPCRLHSGAIAPDFTETARRLHNACDLPKIYEESRLPRMKSVRRLFFTNPGLFFYLKEAEELYEVLSDPNVFCRLLGDWRAFDLLSFFHRYPGTRIFFRRYAARCGAVRLAEQICEDWMGLRGSALHYSVMDECARAEEEQGWNSKRGVRHRRESFSLPVAGERANVPDCSICRGYVFRRLRTVNDFKQAGDRLDNCLSEWHPRSSSVFAIEKGRETLAAVEVRGDMVLQAYAAHNRDIRREKSLAAALYAWQRKHRLDDSMVEDDLEFDPDLDLPF